MTENPKKDSKNKFAQVLQVLKELLLLITILAFVGYILYGLFIVVTQGFGGLWAVAMTNPLIGIPWAVTVIFVVILIAMAGQ